MVAKMSAIHSIDAWKNKRLSDGSINLASQVDQKRERRTNEFVEAIYLKITNDRAGNKFQRNFSFRIYDALTILHYELAVVSIFAFREPVKSYLVLRRIIKDELIVSFEINDLTIQDFLKKEQSPIYWALAKDGALLAKFLRQFPELTPFILSHL
jgi:hypothetical protein